MSEDTAELPIDPEPPKLPMALGSVLRSAREQAKLEIDEVAQQLRMSAHQVTALEQDNHAALPAPTFVRGFIRNYARLLHIDAAPLLDAYQQMQPDSNAHNSISLKLESIPITNNAQKSFRLYLLASFLLIVIGSGWWLYMEWNDKQAKLHVAHAAVALPEQAAAAKPAPAPTPETTAQIQSFTAQPSVAPLSSLQPSAAPQSNPQPSVAPLSSPQPPVAPAPQAQAASQPAPVAAPVTAAQPAPAVKDATPKPVAALPAAPPASLVPAAAPSVAAPGSIHMTFTEQTWVSVTDATGKEVFNKNKAADSEDSADGTPPFNVVVGNAAGVQMFYKNEPVDIVSHTKANVARFTLPQP